MHVHRLCLIKCFLYELDLNTLSYIWVTDLVNYWLYSIWKANSTLKHTNYEAKKSSWKDRGKKKSFPHILHCAPRTLFNACRHTPNFWHHHTPFIIHFCATLMLLRVPLCISSDIECLLHHLPMNNQEIKPSSAPCGTQAEEKNRGGGKDGRT